MDLDIRKSTETAKTGAKSETVVLMLGTKALSLSEYSGTANDLVKKEENIPSHKEHLDVLDPELEKLLQTDPSKGLTDAEVTERLEKFGRNGNNSLQ
jgi:Cation transporter/ATPase, N-terminus